MRLLAAIALLLCLTPLAANERLSDEQILAKLDEATASEARWLFHEGIFATGAVGFAGTTSRGTIAWKRLVDEGNEATFEVLILAQNPIVACFGVAGLSELNPARVTDLLPSLISRREFVESASGCNIGETSPALEATQSVAEHKRVKDLSVLGAARDTWLGAIEKQGARQCDGYVASRLKELLDTQPTSIHHDSVSPYIDALLAEEDLAELKKLAGSDQPTTARQLAVQYIGLNPWMLPSASIVEHVWKRDFEQPETVLRLCAEAAFWESVAGNQSSVSYFDLQTTNERTWQTLTEKDWNWLLGHENDRVREAATSLKKNPITGWRVDDDIPEDPAQRQHWLQVALMVARRANNAEKDRVLMLLRSVLQSDVTCILANPFSPYESPLEWRFHGAFGGEHIYPIALDALEDEDAESRLAGLRLLAATVAHADKTFNVQRALRFWEGRDDALSKLMDDAEHESASWAQRSSLVMLFEALDRVPVALEERYKETRRRWLVGLAQALVSDPRTIPLRAHGEQGLLSVVRGISDKTLSELIPGIYEGQEPISRNKDGSPTDLSTRLLKLREIAAKLD